MTEPKTQAAHSGTCPSDCSVFAPFADMCSCGCNRVSKLDSVHKTAVGIVPLYLCRYCKATQTRQRKQNAQYVLDPAYRQTAPLEGLAQDA